MNGEEMTTKDLHEFASLDALGLLDYDERRAFEEAFEQAPGGLKASIRREQDRFASVEEFLPDVEQPKGLRARVLSSVRDAVTALNAPADEADAVAGRIGVSPWSLRRNVSPLWRAACIGFATATVVLVAVGSEIHTQYSEAMTSIEKSAFVDEIQERLGPKFVKVLMSDTADHVRFTNAANVETDNAGNAMVLSDRASGAAMFVCRGLPKIDQGEYRLILVDPVAGVETVVARFTTDGEFMSKTIEPIEIEAGMSMTIVGSDTGKPVLTSTTI
jgi:hypothetical protein